MQKPKYPTDLTNKQWKRIKDLLPPAKTGGRHRTTNLREVMNAILYVTKTGIQWRMLPHDFPPYNTVYGYFWQWRNDGVWQRVHDTLRAQVRQQAGRHKHPTAGCLDSQSVKTTQVPGVRGFDAGKLIKGRKRHVLVDTMGLLLVVVVTAASVQDRDGARLLFKQLPGGCKKLRKIWVDGSYRGELIAWAWNQCKLLLTPVLRPQECKGFVLLPRRWVVERTFAWLNLCRRLSKDYERQTSSSEAFVYLAMTRLMLQRLDPA
jgi:putative transposase